MDEKPIFNVGFLRIEGSLVEYAHTKRNGNHIFNVYLISGRNNPDLWEKVRDYYFSTIYTAWINETK